MTAENQKKYDEKLKRMTDALALKTPDRVPVDITGGTFMIQRTGHTIAESNYDETLEIAKEAAKKLEEEAKAAPKAITYGSEQIREGKFDKNLEGWLAYRDTPTDNYKIVKEDKISFLRLENPEGFTYGVCQAVPVVSGTVYKLSAKFRTVKADENKRTGARLAFFAPNRKEQQVIWSENFDEWTNKSIIFTNTYSGPATIYFHLGNFKSASSGDITDISLKPVN